MQKLLLVFLAGITLFFSSCGQGENATGKAETYIADLRAETALRDEEGRIISSDISGDRLSDFDNIYAEEVEKNRVALSDLGRSGKDIYSLAEKATVSDIEDMLYRMRMRERYALDAKEAERRLLQAEKAVEDSYRLRLFNLRMELEVLRLSPREREVLTAKLQSLLAAKRAERMLLRKSCSLKNREVSRTVTL